MVVANGLVASPGAAAAGRPRPTLPGELLAASHVSRAGSQEVFGVGTSGRAPGGGGLRRFPRFNRIGDLLTDIAGESGEAVLRRSVAGLRFSVVMSHPSARLGLCPPTQSAHATPCCFDDERTNMAPLWALAR